MDAAWDVQAFLEEHVPKESDAVVILLDYAKFSDSFGHRVVADLLTAIGVDKGLVDVIDGLNTQALRHFQGRRPIWKRNWSAQRIWTRRPVCFAHCPSLRRNPVSRRNRSR